MSPSLTPDAARRYARQLLLPEFSRGGQAQLATAPLNVPEETSAPSREVALRYGERVGLGGARVAPLSEAEQAKLSSLLGAFRHPTSRAVAEGAALALLSVHRALEPSEPGS
jgi:hypothetical protein